MNSIVNAAIEHGVLEKRLYDEFDEAEHLRIIVCGVGGGGNNTVNRLNRLGIGGGDLVAVNTDKQDLQKLQGKITKVLIGARLMRGLGAGGFPELGAKAAESSRQELTDVLGGTHLMFLVAGMGGGTGTGAAPVVASIAKEAGAVVVAIVTFPFKLERARLKKAREGIENLRKVCDTVIVVDNNKLVEYVPKLALDKAFLVADEVVARAVKGITETIMQPSLINIDFADIRTIMSSGGLAVISVGEGEGQDRVASAVKTTLAHPLLDVDFKGAKGALIHIIGGENMTLGEANQIGEQLTAELDPKATVIWGARLEPKMADKIEVITVLTGVKSPAILAEDASINQGAYERENIEMKGV
jgi:cell division protein FtsZ